MKELTLGDLLVLWTRLLIFLIYLDKYIRKNAIWFTRLGTYCNLQPVWILGTVCSMYCFKCLLIASSGTVFINSTMAGKNSLMMLLATSIAELGIKHTKRPSGLGKILSILSSLEGSIRLKYFIRAIFRGWLRTFHVTCEWPSKFVQQL